jgi:hypothetical protein
MRKKRDLGSDNLRNARLATKAQLRKDQAVAEGKSLDDAVKQSIKLHGP